MKIPDEAVKEHWLLFDYEGGGWGCQGCDWQGPIDDYWKMHDSRRRNDNIPF